MAPDSSLASRGWLHERPTLDVVVLVLTIVVALAMLGGLVVIGVLALRPEQSGELGPLVDIIDGQIGTILGALLGLIAGQATGRRLGAAAAPSGLTAPPAAE